MQTSNRLLGYKIFEQSGMIFPDYEVIEGDTRIYKTPGGDYPSMTSVLSVFKKYDKGLDAWRKRIGEIEADKITKDASDRGNALHDYAEKYLENELIHSEMEGAAKVLFNRSRKLYEPIDLVFGTEVALHSNVFKMAGRADAIVSFNGRGTILDHKNSRQAFDIKKQFARRKIFIYMLQCTGYSICFEEEYDMRLDQGVLVIANYLKGNAEKIVFDIDDNLRNEFAIACDAYYNGTDIRKTSEYFKL